MNFYGFHIGDYCSHTRHLSLLEDLAYRRLLDWYYLHERPFNGRSTDVARLIGMREHEAEVEAVLREFFEEVEGRGWVNKRADEEIEAYTARRKSASEAGKRSASTRNKAGNGRSTDVEPTLNVRSTDVEPTFNGTATDVQLTITTPTPTPTPIEEKTTEARAPRTRVVPVERPDEIPDELWNAWLAIRKAKRAPLTEAALELLREEASKANWTLAAAVRECVARGWQGFKAEWVAKAATLGATPPPMNKFAKPVSHMSNMPLGTPSCECDECVAYRAKRAVTA